MTAARTHAFETSHPAVPAVYLGGTVLIAMFALQPVLVAVSLAGALAASLASGACERRCAGCAGSFPPWA